MQEWNKLIGGLGIEKLFQFWIYLCLRSRIELLVIKLNFDSVSRFLYAHLLWFQKIQLQEDEIELASALARCFLCRALGVDRYAFFRADADTDYYRPSRPITDILNRYMSGAKITINVKIKNNKGSDKNCLPWCWLHFLLLSSSMHPSTIRVI